MITNVPRDWTQPGAAWAILNTPLCHFLSWQEVACGQQRHISLHPGSAWTPGRRAAAGYVAGRFSDEGSLRPREVQGERLNGRVRWWWRWWGFSEKLHGKDQERTINTNLLPAWWATSSQVGVVSIAVNAIYLTYWPITTSPLCVPAEGSPAVSQQGRGRTIDWGVVLFLQADPHSCSCLSLFLSLSLPLPLSVFFPPVSLYLPFCHPLSLCLFLPLSRNSRRISNKRHCPPALANQ